MMDIRDTRGYIRHTFIRLRPKHYRAKLLLSLVILVFVGVGILFNWFVRTGVFNFSSHSNQLYVELGSLNLEQYGIPGDLIEGDLNRFISSMNNAQEGVHFLLGVISGFVFTQVTAGFSVGLIKEAYDLINTARLDQLNRGYLIDTTVDLIFWSLGGIVGFYLLTGLYDLFREHEIDGIRDLFRYVRRSALRWWNDRKKGTEPA